MITFTATPEEFGKGTAVTKAVQLLRTRNRKVPQPHAPFKQLPRQIGTITPEQFGRGDAYWGKRARGHRQELSAAIKPLDESLPDVLLDLIAEYGNAYPRPQGNVIQFTLVDEHTTYTKAKAKLDGILREHGLYPMSLTITPGPEKLLPWNRTIKLALAKSELM